jgi:hypothetical protein
MVTAFRSPNESSPPKTVGKSRSEDFVPNTWILIANLVDNHAIEILTAQAIRIVRPVKTNPTPPKINP